MPRSAPLQVCNGTLSMGARGSLPMRTTLKSLAAGAMMLTAAQADAGEFLATGPLGPRYASPYGRSYAPAGYRRGYLASRYYYVAEQGPDLGAAIAGALAGAALQLIPPRRRGARATAAACSGTGPAAAASCGSAAARGTAACAVRRRARRHRGQFARHYAGGGGGGARRLVRQPRRRAAVPEAAGEVGLPRGSGRSANTRIDSVWPDVGDILP